ncbi:MAG: ribonuclease P protein component, partial [Phycisphaerales bacterium]
NRVKRKCREAFRLTIQFLPTGTDILITVRPHATMELEEYKELILKGVSC